MVPVTGRRLAQRVWYNCYTIALCASNSISRKAKVCGKIQSAQLASKRFKKYGRSLTTSTLVWMFRSNTGPSGGRAADSIL